MHQFNAVPNPAVNPELSRAVQESPLGLALYGLVHTTRELIDSNIGIGGKIRPSSPAARLLQLCEKGTTDFGPSTVTRLAEAISSDSIDLILGLKKIDKPPVDIYAIARERDISLEEAIDAEDRPNAEALTKARQEEVWPYLEGMLVWASVNSRGIYSLHQQSEAREILRRLFLASGPEQAYGSEGLIATLTTPSPSTNDSEMTTYMAERYGSKKNYTAHLKELDDLEAKAEAEANKQFIGKTKKDDRRRWQTEHQEHPSAPYDTRRVIPATFIALNTLFISLKRAASGRKKARSK